MLALLLAAALPLLPDQVPTPAAPDQTRPGVLATHPFSRLFPIQEPPTGDLGKAVEARVPARGIKKKVVCGMTLLIVDGSVDPKMAIAPKGKDVDPGMPRVRKPMCGEGR